MKIKEDKYGKSIFDNCFTLKFENKTIEKNCEEDLRNSNTKAMIGFLCFFICVYIIVVVVLQTVPIHDIAFENSLEALYGSVTGVFLVVDIILFFIQLKNKKVSEAFLYINFIDIQLISNFFLIYMEMWLGKNTYNTYSYSFFTIEYSMKMSYIIFVDNNYVRIFVSFIVLAVIQIPLINYTSFGMERARNYITLCFIYSFTSFRLLLV